LGNHQLKRRKKLKISTFGLLLLALILIVGPVFAKDDPMNRLPPGLQKKVMDGKPLPPGWQKKLVKGKTLDREVYRRCYRMTPVDDQGIITVMVDRRVLRLIEATLEIVEIIR